MNRFLHELRRRRVHRVAALYLAAAWLAVEVADTVFPRLLLPDWSVTLVLVLALMGLPAALTLAWFYDLTRSGIQRTPGVAADRDQPARAVVGAAAGAGWSARRIAGVGAVAVLALAGASWVAVGDGGVPLEEGTVAVLPFRASGDLAHLREGMVDLMATKLSGDVGPRALDPRVTLRAWRESGGEELVPAEAAAAARRLGASHVLTGEVVPAGGAVTLSATLSRTAGMGRAVRATVAGPADSLLQLVDRLSAELLGQEAGLDSDRLASLTSASAEAVVWYLAGQKSERAGQFEEAVEHYGRALEVDTTFALAAWGQASALGWVDQGESYYRARHLAWRHRDRLSRRDRALLTADFGPSGPGGSAPLDDHIEAIEEAIALAPDDPGARERLGDLLLHQGYRIPGAWPSRDARVHLERAAELDPGSSEPLLHVIELAARAGDTAAVRSYYDRYVTASGYETSGAVPPGYTAAVALDDPELLAVYEPRLDSLQGSQVGWMSSAALWAALPTGRLKEVLRREIDVRVPGHADLLLLHLASLELSDGRTSRVRELIAEMESPDIAAYFAFHAAVVMDGDSAHGRRALEDAVAQGRYSDRDRAQIRCLRAHYSAAHGDTTAARATARRTLAEADRADLLGNGLTACGLALTAVVAVAAGSAEAGTAIARADSFATHTDLNRWNAEHTLLLAARLWDAVDRPREALEIARRLELNPNLVPVNWLLHARLAARLGLEDEARAMYRLYLARRESAEPGTRAHENLLAARREVARISAER